MKKQRILSGASAAALAISGIAMPVNVMADEGPEALGACLWTTDTTEDTPTSCAATTFAQFYYGVNNAHYTSVRLDADIVTDRLMGAFKTMTIDLNGHKLSRDTNGLVMKVGQYSTDASKLKQGNLTIIDSAGGGEIVSDADGQAVFQLDNASSLTVNGGALIAKQYATVTVYDGSSVYINGGSLTSGTREVIGGNNAEGDMNTYVTGGTLTSAGGYPTIYMPSQVNLKVSGDAVLNGSILVRMGQIEISGGTIHSTAREYANIESGIEYSGLVALPGVINVLGGSYKSTNTKYGNSLNLNITGGTLISENSSEYGGSVVVYDLDKEAQAMNVKVSGGTFTVKDAQRPVAIYSREDLKLASLDNEIANTVAVEVAGGTYNAVPGYVKPGYKAYAGEGGTYTVLPAEIQTGGNDTTENSGEDATENEQVLSGLAADIVEELVAKFATLTDGKMTLTDGTEVVIDNADAVREALAAGEKITLELTDRAAEASDAIDDELAELAEEGAESLMTLNYEVQLVGSESGKLGTVAKLTEGLNLTADVSGAPELAENATREWIVVRDHEGAVTTYRKVAYDEETELLTFASNMFSLYAIAYLDTLKEVPVPTPETDVETPETGALTNDGAVSRMGAGAVIITVATMIATAVAMEIRAYRKRQERK